MEINFKFSNNKFVAYLVYQPLRQIIIEILWIFRVTKQITYVYWQKKLFDDLNDYIDQQNNNEENKIRYMLNNFSHRKT